MGVLSPSSCLTFSHTNSLRNPENKKLEWFSLILVVFFSVFWVGNNGCSSLLVFLYFFSVPSEGGASVQTCKILWFKWNNCPYVSTGCIFKGISLWASRCSGFLWKLWLFHYVQAYDPGDWICSDLKKTPHIIFAYFLTLISLKWYRNYQ